VHVDRRETAAGLVYGLPVLATDGAGASLPPALIGPDGAALRRVFFAAPELQSIVVPEQRAWVAELQGIRIGVGAIAGRALTLLGLGRGDPCDGPAERGALPDGSSIGAALLAETETGESVLVEGGAIRAVGRFPAIEDGRAISWSNERVVHLSITELVRWIEKHVWERSALVGPHGARIARREERSAAS
jgi:hypothetical protein